LGAEKRPTLDLAYVVLRSSDGELELV
jgi:hypothetical protein